MLLTIHANQLNLSNETIRLLERYYLHFASAYYQSDKNNELMSVIWFFGYMRFSKDLHKEFTLSELRNQINSIEQLPDRRYRIANLYDYLSLELPPHLIPYLIKDIYSSLIKGKAKAYKQLKKLATTYDNARSMYVPILASDFIPQLKQILINKDTNQNTLSILESGLTEEQVLRFEILARYLLYKTVYTNYVYPTSLLEDRRKVLLDEYNIKQLTFVDDEHVIKRMDTYNEGHNLLLESSLNDIKGISINSNVLFDIPFVKDIMPINIVDDIKVPRIYLNNLRLSELEDERKNMSYYLLLQVI